MKVYYNFTKKLMGGVWEIKSDMPYDDIDDLQLSTSQLKLLDLPFRICHGKKQRDIIYYYGDISIEFLSQNIYSFLSRYTNVQPYLYPIKINEVDTIYYFIHDLPQLKFINRDMDFPKDNYLHEVPCFFLQDDIPPLFSLEETRYKIVTPEMKKEMIKAKLTNIAFYPVYGVSSIDEYLELQKNGDLLTDEYKLKI